MNIRRTFILVAVALCSATPPAHAADEPQSSTIQVDVSSFVEPATAVGLIMSGDKTIQRLNPKIEKSRPGTITVSFPYQRSEINEHSVASALVVSDKGEVVFGNVKPIYGNEFDQSLGNIPLCSEDQKVSASLASQASLLEELYRIRLKRRDQAKSQVAEAMPADFLARLQKLERGFGLAREKELNADLPPLELVDRLSRLRDALRNWESKAEVVVTPESTPVPTETEESSAAATVAN